MSVIDQLYADYGEGSSWSRTSQASLARAGNAYLKASSKLRLHCIGTCLRRSKCGREPQTLSMMLLPLGWLACTGTEQTETTVLSTQPSEYVESVVDVKSSTSSVEPPEMNSATTKALLNRYPLEDSIQRVSRVLHTRVIERRCPRFSMPGTRCHGGSCAQHSSSSDRKDAGYSQRIIR